MRPVLSTLSSILTSSLAATSYCEPSQHAEQNLAVPVVPLSRCQLESQSSHCTANQSLPEIAMLLTKLELRSSGNNPVYPPLFDAGTCCYEPRSCIEWLSVTPVPPQRPGTPLNEWSNDEDYHLASRTCIFRCISVRLRHARRIKEDPARLSILLTHSYALHALQLLSVVYRPSG